MWHFYLLTSLFFGSIGAARAQEQAPDSVSATASGPGIQTTHQSIEGLTANSVTTTVIDEATTVLPVWYCGPSETASVCGKSCTQDPSVTVQPTCDNSFNALILLPLVAAPGLFLPPPQGLPTLTIDNGDLKTITPTPESTPEPTPEPKSSDTPSSTPTPSSRPPPEVACVIPPNKVADKAQPAITTEALDGEFTPVPTESIDIEANPLPFLPFTEKGAFGGCGGSGTQGRYFTSSFYQFGNTFARTDGISAINEFCRIHKDNGSVLGPDGFKGDANWSKHKAKHIYQGSFNTKKSGKITVRAIFDVDNRISKLVNEKDCNKNGDDESKSWLIALFNENNCRNWLGQTIDFCNNEAEDMSRSSSDDTKWKEGGTFYYRCGIWEVFKTPKPDSSRPLKPHEVIEDPQFSPLIL